MKITTEWNLNLNEKLVTAKMKKATKAGMLVVVTDIASESIHNSPHLTGNNKRSIRFEVGPGKEVAKEEGSGAVYSTSGYGGYLETGTVKMAARPYMRPALNRHIKKLPGAIKEALG